jgi:hypothetical protein
MSGVGTAVARTPGAQARFLPTGILGMHWARWRLKRERRTMAAMIAIYCRDHHRAGGERPLCDGDVAPPAPLPTSERSSRTDGLCKACAALGAYADGRLDKCVYGVEKPTCLNCPVHCYKRDQREAIREVMRYAGPRMLRRHPILAITHLFDGRRPAPKEIPRRRARITS